MTIAMRHTVADARHLCVWAAAAPAGAQVLYHIGNLASDRIAHPALNDLADVITILVRLDFLATTQPRITLAHIQGFSYIAIRTGRGRAPQSILHNRITPRRYMALDAVANRDPRLSAHRAICRAMVCPEATARSILSDLNAADLIRDDPMKGWQVSDFGVEMLM